MSNETSVARGADRGRRVFPACPEESLILKKPTLGIEHEGGQRFETGSPALRSEIANRKSRNPLAARIPAAPMAGPVSSGIRPRGPTSGRCVACCICGCGRRRLSAAETAYAAAAR